MTCEKCGREIPEGQRFCGFCGASAEVKTIALSPEKRRMVIERLHHAHDICVQAYERIQKSREMCSKAEKRRATSWKRLRKSFPWFFGSVLLVPAPFLLFAFSGNFDWKGFAALTGLIALWAAIPFTLFLILFVFLPRYKGKKLQKQSEQEQQAGVNILSDNAEVLAILPFEYWYPQATQYITRLFETNRANTLQEALKMFDEQRHRWMMENSQQKILATQQEQISLLNEVKSEISSLKSDVNYLVWSDLLDL